MSWLNNFKLGRANYGTLFQLNPTAIDYTPRKIGDLGRGLNGEGSMVTLSRNRPLIRINGNYITPEQFNQFTALMQLDDEPLVFEPVDYAGANVWESWMERVIPTSVTTIPIPENSFTKAARLMQYNGGKAVIRMVGLYAAMTLDANLSMPTNWKQRTGWSANLIAPGIWGYIFKENFNNLATGLLVDAGPWIVWGGNGTTKDVFVSDTPAEVLEGTKSMIFITDGTATALTAYWLNGGHTETYGFIAEYHTATWKAQMVHTYTGDVAVLSTESTEPSQNCWRVRIEVTSSTTADLVIIQNNGEVSRTSLADPFDVHDYKVVSENRTLHGGDSFKVWVDSVPVFSNAVYSGPFDFWGWSVNTTGDAGTIFRFDDLDCHDGDGYDPATGLINIVTSAPLPDLSRVFATYQYNAVAVNLSQVPYRSEGGWVDFYRYNFQLEGM